MVKRPHDNPAQFLSSFLEIFSLDSCRPFYKRDKTHSYSFSITFLSWTAPFISMQLHFSIRLKQSSYCFESPLLGQLSLGPSWSVVLHILQNLYYPFSYTVNSHSLMIYDRPYHNLNTQKKF